MSYDPRAVRVKKEVKAFAASFGNKEKFRTIIRGATKNAEAEARGRTSRNKGDKQ